MQSPARIGITLSVTVKISYSVSLLPVLFSRLSQSHSYSHPCFLSKPLKAGSQYDAGRSVLSVTSVILWTIPGSVSVASMGWHWTRENFYLNGTSAASLQSAAWNFHVTDKCVFIGIRLGSQYDAVASVASWVSWVRTEVPFTIQCSSAYVAL